MRGGSTDGGRVGAGLSGGATTRTAGRRLCVVLADPGADPAAVRAAARTAASPADLPPPRELLGTIVRTIGLEGADHGWEDAPELEGAVRVDPA